MSLRNLLGHASTRMEGQLPVVVTFIVLAALFCTILYPAEITGNEEDYLGWGYRFASPQHFTQYDANFDHSEHLFFFKAISGYPIVWFGFETAHHILRFAQALLWAAAFALLFSVLGIPLLDGILILSLYFMTEPRALAMEWLFLGVEGKTMAYAFVVFSLASAFRGQRWRTAGFAAVATYLHFLVGGFWTICAFAVHAFMTRDWRNALKGCLGYTVLIVPMIVVVLVEQLGGPTAIRPVGFPPADFIYSFMRAPHHVGPYADGKFLTVWLPKALVFAGIFPVAALLALKGKSRELKATAILVAVICVYLWIALGVSWFDRNTGHLGKLFLFRSSALTLLLAFTLPSQLRLTLRQYEVNWFRIGRQSAMVVVALWAIRTGILKDYLLPTLRYGGPPKGLDGLAIQHVTKKDDIILVEPTIDRSAVPRILDRPTLVNDKFVPTNARDIYRWYAYIEWRKKLFETGCSSSMHWMAPVKYLLIPNRKSERLSIENCGPVVWSNDYYMLIRVSPKYRTTPQEEVPRANQ